MSARASRLSDAGLALRSLRAFRGGLLLLAVVALVTSTALSAWPRFASSLLTAELRHEVTQAGAGGRDLATGIRAGGFGPGFGVDPVALWRALPGMAVSVREGMKAPLRAVTAAGDSSARSSDIAIEAPAGAAANSRYSVDLEAYRGLRGTARLVEGSWPGGVSEPFSPDTVVPIVLARPAAELLGWRVGAERASSLDGVRLRLAGIVAPVDGSADFWALDPVRSGGHFADHGDSGKEFGAVGWVDAASWPVIAPRLDDAVASIWYPVVPERVRAEELPAVRGALGGFLAAPPTVAVGASRVPLTFATTLQGPLDAFQARAAPANTLFAILAAGPLAVAVTVLALGARLVVARRREALGLLAARGASPGRLRLSLGTDAVIASVPAAAAGLGLAVALTPGAQPLALPVALAALCAVLPPLALVLAAGSLAPGPEAAVHRASRWRWVAEAVVLGLAVLGVVLLVRRGLEPPGGGTAVDPLVALTPVLVALAACVLVLRVTVVPLGWLTAALRRGRGAVAFLGASGARRSRAGVVWPVFALVAGVSIALFSVSVLTTARNGLDEGARARVGSDLSVTAAATFSPTQLAALKRVPGVAHTATVDWAGGVDLSVGDESQVVSGYLVDPAELDAVQRDLPPDARLSAALTGGIPGRTGAVLGGWDSRVPVTGALLSGPGSTVHLAVTELDFRPGVYLRDAQWVLIDRTRLPASSEVSGRPQTLLVSLAPGADAARVHAGLARIAGAGATIGDATAEREALRSSPLIAGTETVALLSIALTALLCVAALLLTLVTNTAARIRLVATLRTIGFGPRQTAGVLAWELGPVLVVGIVAGAVTGLLLPGIVLGPLDLRGFTGSPVQPVIAQDPLLVAAALAGFVAVAALATVVALAGARRASPAAVLRTGEGE